MKKLLLMAAAAMCCFAAKAEKNPYLPYMATAHDTIDLLVSRDYSMRYGYMNFSTPNEKLLYMQAVDSICHFTQNWRSGGWTENRVTAYPYLAGATNPGIYGYMDMLYRLKCDMPEMWVMSNSIPRNTTDNRGYQIRLFLGYTPSLYAQELVIIDSVVSGIVARAETLSSDYEKVLLLHDTLCQITRYGDMSGAYAGTIKGVFVNHRAVCEGWARAFLYLCQKTGINCLYIDGRLNTNDDLENPSWGNHAWNHVQVDGQWYLVDATTDGALGTVGHRAFLKGQTYFDTHYTYLTAGDLGGENNNNLTAYPTLPTLATGDYVPGSTPTGLTPNDASKGEDCRKQLRNGQLLIESNGDWYTVQGVKM